MVKNFYGRIFFIVILLMMCVGVKAVRSQEKEIVDEYLEYAANLTNFNESTIVDIITSMSFGGVQYGKDSINSMLSNRNIILNAAVDDYTAAVVTSMLSFYDAKSGEDILFYINSPGGSVYAGLGIYDTMQYISSDVSTICTGMAASMAAVLLVAGAEGKRFALNHSRVMIHQPMGGAQGQASDIEITAREIQKLKKELYTIISNHSGQPFEKVEKDSDRDYWMTSHEAKDYGMIDDVLIRAKR